MKRQASGIGRQGERHGDARQNELKIRRDMLTTGREREEEEHATSEQQSGRTNRQDR
jgi:hypothetical protein